MAVLGLLLLVLGGIGFHARNAHAEVIHGHGFTATVLGWTSWYGSYRLPGVGTAWCIDHGRHAPDTTYTYVPSAVDRPAGTTTAIAWLLARHGDSTDPVEAAATMLVLHDLMGATYPYGRLDVDHLQPGNLAGFDGQESAIIARARAWKADALSHSALRGPLSLHLQPIGASGAGGPPSAITISVTDAAGHGVGDVTVTVRSSGVTGALTTDANGVARLTLTGAPPQGTLDAEASVVDLHLSAFGAGPSAQRVARPARVTVADSLSWSAPKPATLSLRKVDRRTGAPLAGAVLSVTADADHDGVADGLARQVTSGDTPVSVTGLTAGHYLVSEQRPPAGFRADPTPRSVDLTPGEVATVTFADDALPTTVTATKVDASSGRALEGATYDLYRHVSVGDDATDAGDDPSTTRAALPAPPSDTAALPHMVWVARATSDADGQLTWPPQPSDLSYCVRELRAPPGYQVSSALVCTDGAPTATKPAHLTLSDEATPVTVPPTTSTTTTTVTPTTTTPVTTTPPTTSPPTTPAAATTPVTPAPTVTRTTAAPAAQPQGGLAFTGAATRQWASMGLGLVLLGAAALAGRRRPRPPG